MAQSRTNYSRAYKMETAKLTQDNDRTVKSVAEDPGINYKTLCRWKRKGKIR